MSSDIHVGLPGDIESYIQENGRDGYVCKPIRHKMVHPQSFKSVGEIC